MPAVVISFLTVFVKSNQLFYLYVYFPLLWPNSFKLFQLFTLWSAWYVDLNVFFESSLILQHFPCDFHLLHLSKGSQKVLLSTILDKNKRLFFSKKRQHPKRLLWINNNSFNTSFLLTLPKKILFQLFCVSGYLILIVMVANVTKFYLCNSRKKLSYMLKFMCRYFLKKRCTIH